MGNKANGSSGPIRQFDTIKEVAARTGKCYRTIHRAVCEGKIKSVQMGGSVMIPRSEVERVLAHGWR